MWLQPQTGQVVGGVDASQARRNTRRQGGPVHQTHESSRLGSRMPASGSFPHHKSLIAEVLGIIACLCWEQVGTSFCERRSLHG